MTIIKKDYKKLKEYQPGFTAKLYKTGKNTF